MRKFFSAVILISFISSLITAPAGAQILPIPGTTTARLTASYQPPVLLGLKIHPENPLLFDFIVTQGQNKLSQDELKSETEKLVKYFFAALTIPDREVWVNLSPYEKDRIIPAVLEQTTMGKTMLEQDYLLKQLASSLTNPDEKLGQQYWSKVKEQTKAQMGTTDISMNTFNKVWIVPHKAEVLESRGIVLVGEKRLKVLMDEDHSNDKDRSKSLVSVKADVNRQVPSPKIPAEDSNRISSHVFRTTILPSIEKEINEGQNFAGVRQIYHSVILAAWYKKALKESLLGKVYTDQGKIAGVQTDDKDMKQRIYEQYLAAFKKGVYNVIKEETDVTGDLIPRKYFSGGLTIVPQVTVVKVSPQAINDRLRGSSGIIAEVTGEEPSVADLVKTAETTLENGKKVITLKTGQVTTGTLGLTGGRFSIGPQGDTAYFTIRISPENGVSLDYHNFGNVGPFVHTRILNLQKSSWNGKTVLTMTQQPTKKVPIGLGIEVSKAEDGYQYKATVLPRASSGVSQEFQKMAEELAASVLSFDAQQKYQIFLTKFLNENNTFDSAMTSAAINSTTGFGKVLKSIYDQLANDTKYSDFTNPHFASILGWTSYILMKDSSSSGVTLDNTAKAKLYLIKVRTSHDGVKKNVNEKTLRSVLKQLEETYGPSSEKFNTPVHFNKYGSSPYLDTVDQVDAAVLLLQHLLGFRINPQIAQETRVVNGQEFPSGVFGLQLNNGDWANYVQMISELAKRGITIPLGELDVPEAQSFSGNIPAKTQAVFNAFPILRHNAHLADQSYQSPFIFLVAGQIENVLFNALGNAVNISAGTVDTEYLLNKLSSYRYAYTTNPHYPQPVQNETISYNDARDLVSIIVEASGLTILDTSDVMAGVWKASAAKRPTPAALNYINSQKSASSAVAEITASASSPTIESPVGGIDFDPSSMNLQIKRDGNGVPLPLPQQNLQHLDIQGLYPVIINMIPINAQTLPIFLGQAPQKPAREIEKVARVEK